MGHFTQGSDLQAIVRQEKRNLANRAHLLDHLPPGITWPNVTNEAPRKRCFTSRKTLDMFLQQVLNADQSCRSTVMQTLTSDYACDLPLFSSNTAAYCKARKRLPTELILGLTTAVGQYLHQNSPDYWKWQGRSVKVVDGTTASMPDTVDNQTIYPQIPVQQPGLGFPIIRLVTIMSLTSGAILDMSAGNYWTSEHALFRELLNNFSEGDILLGDRYYCSYFLIALLRAQGVDGVFRLHAGRKFFPRKGRWLGKEDHIVLWHKPQRPDWMDSITYHALPDTLFMREFRMKNIIIATTLLDKVEYCRKDIFLLYHERWQIELNFRSIKTIMKMDILRCQTPDMVLKEIWVHLLAYNILRWMIFQSAYLYKKKPRELSFKATLQVMTSYYALIKILPIDYRHRLYQHLLLIISQHPVGKRPHRCEPRCIKRRQKSYDLLMEPRHIVRQRLIHGRA